MQFIEVGCNYPEWDTARRESIVLSFSENATDAHDTTSRNFCQDICTAKP